MLDFIVFNFKFDHQNFDYLFKKLINFIICFIKINFIYYLKKENFNQNEFK